MPLKQHNKLTTSISDFAYRICWADKGRPRFFQLLLLVTAVSSSHALLGPQDSQPIDFKPQSINEVNPGSHMTPTIEKLLQLQRSIQDLLQQRQRLSEAVDAEESINEDTHTVKAKRVFCNGFTGCGGRFRGRRVQQRGQVKVSKRVLKPIRCNDVVCFINNGKETSDDVNDRGKINPMAPFAADQIFETNSVKEPQSGLAKTKRLFCNGYGGCRNMGKRTSIIPVFVQRSPGQRASHDNLLDLLLQNSKQKRFFASGYDNKVDSFVGGMARRK